MKQVSDRVWLVSFMHYDLGYFDDETCRLEPIENPFGPKVLPMNPERTVTYVPGMDPKGMASPTGPERLWEWTIRREVNLAA